MTLTAPAIILASAAAPWAGIWICLLFIVIAAGIVAAIIRRGIATRRPWPWWLALATIVFVVFFVITTYYPEIRNHLIFRLLNWLGL